MVNYGPRIIPTRRLHLVVVWKQKRESDFFRVQWNMSIFGQISISPYWDHQEACDLGPSDL